MKTKKINKFSILLTALFILLLGSLPLFAAAIPSELPMIKNAIVLKAYALNRPARAQMNVSSSGQVPNQGVNVSIYKEGNETADDLINRLANTSVKFTLASAKDPVDLSVSVYDAEGYPLFIGYKRIMFEPDRNGQITQLPSTYGDPRFITINKRIRIPFPGVKNVEIVFRNSNGQIITNPGLTTSGEGFLFPVDYVDRQGEVKITYSDQGQDRTVVYDLQSTLLRSQASLASYNSNLPMGIEGYFRVEDNNANINLGSLPKDAVIRYGNTSLGPLIINIWLTLEGGVAPRAVIVARSSRTDQTVLLFDRYPLNSIGQVQGGVLFIPGKYFLFLETEVDQFREIHFDYDGGGKG